MSWRRVFGVLAVLLVIATGLGTALTLGTTNDLLLGSTEGLAAIGALVAVLAGLAVIVLLGGPSREWFGNPYW